MSHVYQHVYCNQYPDFYVVSNFLSKFYMSSFVTWNVGLHRIIVMTLNLGKIQYCQSIDPCKTDENCHMVVVHTFLQLVKSIRKMTNILNI